MAVQTFSEIRANQAKIAAERQDSVAVKTAGEALKYVNGKPILVTPFSAKGVLTSAAAVTPIVLIDGGDVPEGKKVYVESFIAKVNGGTPWATTANVKLQDQTGTPIDFVTMLVAALTANAVIVPGTANVTLENALALMSGGGFDKGLQIVGNVNGTGSDLVVIATGFIG